MDLRMDSRMPGTDRRCIVSWMAAQSSADTKTAAALPARRVFITENETNFLAFPHGSGAIVALGAGNGWEALARIQWR